MTKYEALTLLVGFVAVVISAVSLIRTRKVEAEQLKLQGKMAELAEKQLENLAREEDESQNASIDVSFELHKSSYKLVLTNIGQAVAKEVDCKLTPRGGGGNPLSQQDCKRKLPIPILKPGASVGILAAFSTTDATTFDVELSWKDVNDRVVVDETFLSL